MGECEKALAARRPSDTRSPTPHGRLTHDDDDNDGWPRTSTQGPARAGGAPRRPRLPERVGWSVAGRCSTDTTIRRHSGRRRGAGREAERTGRSGGVKKARARRRTAVRPQHGAAGAARFKCAERRGRLRRVQAHAGETRVRASEGVRGSVRAGVRGSVRASACGCGCGRGQQLRRVRKKRTDRPHGREIRGTNDVGESRTDVAGTRRFRRSSQRGSCVLDGWTRRPMADEARPLGPRILYRGGAGRGPALDRAERDAVRRPR